MVCCTKKKKKEWESNKLERDSFESNKLEDDSLLLCITLILKDRV